jgi:hypothetical protein
LALRSTCTPCAGSCSAVPSLHPRGRNSRCSIWCRASHCTDSPRGHTCLFRAALPWRGSFRPGTCARRRFHGEMQRSGLNTLTGRCVLAEDTDETDCRQRRFGAAGLTADVHSADWLVHSVDTVDRTLLQCYFYCPGFRRAPQLPERSAVDARLGRPFATADV